MMNKKQLAVAVSALVLSAAASAQAYVGGSLGATHANIDCPSGASCDDSDTGGKIFGGYKFPGGFAVEGLYVNWGQASGTLAGVTEKIKAQGWGVAGAFHGEFTKDWVYAARLGLLRNEGKATAPGFSDTDHTTKPYVGVSVGYRVTPALSIDLAADFSRVKADGDSASVRMIGLGVTYGF